MLLLSYQLSHIFKVFYHIQENQVTNGKKKIKNYEGLIFITKSKRWVKRSHSNLMQEVKRLALSS